MVPGVKTQFIDYLNSFFFVKDSYSKLSGRDNIFSGSYGRIKKRGTYLPLTLILSLGTTHVKMRGRTSKKLYLALDIPFDVEMSN